MEDSDGDGDGDGEGDGDTFPTGQDLFLYMSDVGPDAHTVAESNSAG